MNRSRAQQIKAGIATALLLLGVNAAVSYRSLARVLSNERRVSHTYAVLAKLEETLSTLKDAETGQRGYVITGNPTYLEPHTAAVRMLATELRELRQMTADNPAQQDRLDRLEPLVEQRMAVIDETIQTRRSQGFEAAQALILTDRGKLVMDQIRQQIGEMKAVEQDLLQQRLRSTDLSLKSSLLAFTVSTAINLLLLGLIFLLVRQDQIERDREATKVRQLNATLERRVEERTAQLQDANAALEGFAYSVAHDLRAPLRGMQGLSEALLEDYGDRLDETGQIYAREIVNSAGQLENLIQDLLTYSRLSCTDLSLQSVSLEGAIAEAIAQVQQMFDLASAPHLSDAIRVELPLPTVAAHRTTLVQVMINLIGNAVKFGDCKALRVRIWAEPAPAAGWVRLWVEDNGIGIAPEHHSRIFRVFERLHGVETYPGTGIGLAIVQKGVERMGGAVGVESALGQGSRFWLQLRSVLLPEFAALAPEQPERSHD